MYRWTVDERDKCSVNAKDNSWVSGLGKGNILKWEIKRGKTDVLLNVVLCAALTWHERCCGLKSPPSFVISD